MSIENASVALPRSHGVLRLEEVDAVLLLPQILRLRATAWGRWVSLAPDLLRWGDAEDVGAAHWCVFNDAELVAAGRMSFHASPDDLAVCSLSTVQLQGLSTPIAVISHTAVHPLYGGLHLEKALDAARIERADQLRQATLIAVAETADRLATLEALGFLPVGGLRVPGHPYPIALSLDLSRRGTAQHRRPFTRPL